MVEEDKIGEEGKRAEDENITAPHTLWQLKHEKKIYLPIPTIRLERWISEGKVKEDDLVWRSGFPGWKRVIDIEVFKLLFERIRSSQAKEK